jgi:lipid-binding SYLF domain-containing protein
VLRELRDIPDKGIPEDVWNKAACVRGSSRISRSGIRYRRCEFGKGVLSCRSGQSWSARCFIELAKEARASRSARADRPRAAHDEPQWRREAARRQGNLGAERPSPAARSDDPPAAAPYARITAEILAYSRAKGLFAGVDISGGVLRRTRTPMPASMART